MSTLPDDELVDDDLPPNLRAPVSAGTPLDRLLALLPGARQNGAGWQARCPAHEDRIASLSITSGDDGRVLLKCHAGCEARTIVEAIGLTLADLFPPRHHEGPEHTYDYRDEASALLFQVCRFPGKQFRQRRPDGHGGWLWKLGDVRRVLYRLPELKGKEALAVVEGCKDADRLWTIGIPATTNAGGAGKWRPEYVEQLKTAGCKRVAILPDNDPPGEAHGRQVARACHDAGLCVRVLPLPGLRAKGDVSDWLATGHTKDELLEAIRACPIFNAGRPAAAGFKLELTSLADLLSEPDDATDWIVEDRIPAGAIVLLAGRPKAGKSTLARDLAFAVASGERWLGWRTTYCRVWLLALEDKRSEVKKHFRQMGATGTEPIRIFAGQAPSEVLPELQRLAEQERPGLIIVDTLQRILKARDLSDYAEVTTRFEPLLQLARGTGATLLLLTHASTHSDRTGLDAVLGSTALTGSADNVFVLQRTDKYRTLSSVQRIGPDLEPVVIERNDVTGRVAPAGAKRDLDDRELGDRIVEALRLETEPVPESWIETHVEGRNADKVRVLRRLLGMSRVERQGAGGRRDPYRYTLSRSVSCSRESAISPNSPESREPQSSSSFIDRNLDFGHEVPEVPYKEYREPQVRTSVDVSFNHVTTSIQVPEVPEVPGSFRKCQNPAPETRNTPDETESDSGSRTLMETDDAEIV